MIYASQSNRFLQDRGYDHSRPDLLLMVERRGLEWKPQASNDAALFVRESSWHAKAAGAVIAIAVPSAPLKPAAEAIAWRRVDMISHRGVKETTEDVRRIIADGRGRWPRDRVLKKR